MQTAQRRVLRHNVLSNLTFIPGGNGGDKAADLSGNPRFAELLHAAGSLLRLDHRRLVAGASLSPTPSILRAPAMRVLLVARAGVTKYPVGAASCRRAQSRQYPRVRSERGPGEPPGRELLRIQRKQGVGGSIAAMIRLFNVYYPTRTIVLLMCEALIVSGSFLLATLVMLWAGHVHLPELRVWRAEDCRPDHSDAAVLLLLRSLRAAADLGAVGDLLPPAPGPRISRPFCSRRSSISFPRSDLAHYVLLLGLDVSDPWPGGLAQRL